MKKMLPALLLLASINTYAVPYLEDAKTVNISIEKEGKVINKYSLSQSQSFPIVVQNTLETEYISEVNFNEKTKEQVKKKAILQTGMVLVITPYTKDNKEYAQLNFTDIQLKKMDKAYIDNASIDNASIDLPTTTHLQLMKNIDFSRGSNQQVELAKDFKMHISVK